MATITNAEIQEIYIGYLGRAADKAGLLYWIDQVSTDALTLEQLRANITNHQPEYLNVYGQLSRGELVETIYQALFERSADISGLAYWVDGAGASVNDDQLILAVINGAGAADRAVLDNKIAVADYYTTGAASQYDQTIARSVLENVGITTASVQEAKAYIDSLFPQLKLITALESLEATNDAISDFLASRDYDSNPATDDADEAAVEAAEDAAGVALDAEVANSNSYDIGSWLNASSAIKPVIVAEYQAELEASLAAAGNNASAASAVQSQLDALVQAVDALAQAQADVETLEQLQEAATAAEQAFADENAGHLIVLDTDTELATPDGDIFILKGIEDHRTTILNFGLQGDDRIFFGSDVVLNRGDIAVDGQHGTQELFITEVAGDAVLLLESTVNSSATSAPETQITLTGLSRTDITYADGFLSLI